MATTKKRKGKKRKGKVKLSSKARIKKKSEIDTTGLGRVPTQTIVHNNLPTFKIKIRKK